MASTSPINLIPEEQDLQLYQGGPVVINCAVYGFEQQPNQHDGRARSSPRFVKLNPAHQPSIATFTVTWTNQATGQFTLSLTSCTDRRIYILRQCVLGHVLSDTNSPINDYPLCWGVVTDAERRELLNANANYVANLNLYGSSSSADANDCYAWYAGYSR